MKMQINNLYKQKIIDFGYREIPYIFNFFYDEFINIYYKWYEYITFDYIIIKLDIDLFGTWIDYLYDIVDIENETNFFPDRILEWLKKNWIKIVQSDFYKNFYNFIDYSVIELDLIAFVILYFYEIGFSEDDFSDLDIIRDFSLDGSPIVELISWKLELDQIHLENDQDENQLFEVINLYILDIIKLQITKIYECLELAYGERYLLEKSIIETLKIEIYHAFIDNEFDYFDRDYTELIQQNKNVEKILDTWEEIIIDEPLYAARKLANYFEGEVINISPNRQQSYSTKEQNDMQYKFSTTCVPKYLFSNQTFDLLAELFTESKSEVSYSLVVYTHLNYDKILEFIEEPFNQLCNLVLAKLPKTIAYAYVKPKWHGVELKQEFGIENILYIKINKTSLSVGIDQNKHKDLLFNKFIVKSELSKFPTPMYLERLFSFPNHEIVINKDELLTLPTHKVINLIQENFITYNNLIAKVIIDPSSKEVESLTIKQQYFTWQNLKYTLSRFSEDIGVHETELQKWIHAINRKGQAILQGPPGTGKTFIANKLAKHLISDGDGFSELVQFHPSYSYEDFMQGIRPQTENGQLTYSLVPGRFLEFCKKAESYEDTCVLIIDEINRANLSNVFGELMYLLEYRDKEIALAGSNEPFSIPQNVRIIGTMNTADRSIALVDHALRRRFAFIKIYPNYEVLKNYHEETETQFPIENLIPILQHLNETIDDPNYQIGISFFMISDLQAHIEEIWTMEIEPYLEEYFYDQPDKVDEFRWNKVRDRILQS